MPIASEVLQGQDALLSTLMIPLELPVVTAAINGAENAGLLALQILAQTDKCLEGQLRTARAAE